MIALYGLNFDLLSWMNLKVRMKLFLYSHYSLFACVDTQYLSHEIFTRLVVYNCLSFTFRLGELPSPLMAIFGFNHRIFCYLVCKLVLTQGPFVTCTVNWV